MKGRRSMYEEVSKKKVLKHRVKELCEVLTSVAK